VCVTDRRVARRLEHVSRGRPRDADVAEQTGASGRRLTLCGFLDALVRCGCVLRAEQLGTMQRSRALQKPHGPMVAVRVRPSSGMLRMLRVSHSHSRPLGVKCKVRARRGCNAAADWQPFARSAVLQLDLTIGGAKVEVRLLADRSRLSVPELTVHFSF